MTYEEIRKRQRFNKNYTGHKKILVSQEISPEEKKRKLEQRRIEYAKMAEINKAESERKERRILELEKEKKLKFERSRKVLLAKTISNTNKRSNKKRKRRDKRKNRNRNEWHNLSHNEKQIIKNERLLLNKREKNKKKKERKYNKKCVDTSWGECRINSFLNIKKVKVVREHQFDDCVNPKTNNHLSFDFYLQDLNICIEYDGEQHFKIVEEFHGKDIEKAKIKLKEQQYRDEIKNDYCLKNNIRLIRIPYKKYFDIPAILAKELVTSP